MLGGIILWGCAGALLYDYSMCSSVIYLALTGAITVAWFIDHVTGGKV